MNGDNKSSLSMIRLSRMLGEDYIDLLSDLPDGFYKLPFEAKDTIWGKMLERAEKAKEDNGEINIHDIVTVAVAEMERGAP